MLPYSPWLVFGGGRSFLNSFPGGVEFFWGGAAPAMSTGGAIPTGAPSISFYGDERGTEASRSDLCRVEVTTLPDSGLPSIMLSVNGELITWGKRLYPMFYGVVHY